MSPVLLGYGAHGRDIEEIYRRQFCADLDRFDDDPTKGLPPISECSEPLGYVGVNDPTARREIANRSGVFGGYPLGCLEAKIAIESVGLSSVIAPGVIALVDVTIGAHTHINYGASMTRCTVGDFVTVSPGAVICGGVEIGDETLIGAGAVICDRVTIGQRCVIAAGAVVPPESVVPDDTTVIGVWKPEQPAVVSAIADLARAGLL